MTTIDTVPATDGVPTDDAERIAALEATVASLVERLQGSPESRALPTEPEDEPAGSRRHLLKLAAGAAAGGAALAVARTSGKASAGDTDPILAGRRTTSGDTGTSTTILDYENTTGPIVTTALGFQNGNILTVRDRPSGLFIAGSENASAYPAAIAGYGFSAVPHGVFGVSSNGGGFGVVGDARSDGGAGVLARGRRANVELAPDGDSPATRTDAHVVGELVADTNGDLWYCAVAGTPGTWRKVAGEASAGTFHAATPFRVYDSRQEGSAGIAGSSDVTLSVKDARDVESYAVVTPDAVPSGAKAVSANVVAIRAVGQGFATVNPGGDTSVGAAALNWADGQTIGNAGIFKISGTRELTVLVRGITNINLTVDITGYWL